MPLSEETIADIAKVHAEAWRASHAGILSEAAVASHTAERHERRLRDDGASPGIKTFLVRIGGEAAGMLSIDTQPDVKRRETGEIRAVYLLPGYWGRSIKKLMLDYAVHALAGHSEIFLWVMNSNTRARQCYEKFGFEFSGIEKPLLPERGITEMKYNFNPVRRVKG